ncbi:hypothetical protein EMIT0P44_120078 [Pseudomonas sp. IT-P44]
MADDAFAGKPRSYKGSGLQGSKCRSWLASDGGRKTGADL